MNLTRKGHFRIRWHQQRESELLAVLDAGASVAMMYTAIVYGGVGTVTRVKKEMREIKQKDLQPNSVPFDGFWSNGGSINRCQRCIGFILESRVNRTFYDAYKACRVKICLRKSARNLISMQHLNP